MWTAVPDYELVCYHLLRCLAPAQALYLLLALVKIRYVAQANTLLLYHPPQDSLNLCTLEGLVHVRLGAAHQIISFCDVACPQLAQLRGHFLII